MDVLSVMASSTKTTVAATIVYAKKNTSRYHRLSSSVKHTRTWRRVKNCETADVLTPATRTSRRAFTVCGMIAFMEIWLHAFLETVQMLMWATLHWNGIAIHHCVWLARDKLHSESWSFFTPSDPGVSRQEAEHCINRREPTQTQCYVMISFHICSLK